MEKIITVDKSGDLKIPPEIKDSLDLKKMINFYFQQQGFHRYKKIKQPSLSERFINLANTIEKRFQEKGVNKTDVVKAIQWARK